MNAHCELNNVVKYLPNCSHWPLYRMHHQVVVVHSSAKTESGLVYTAVGRTRCMMMMAMETTDDDRIHKFSRSSLEEEEDDSTYTYVTQSQC